MTDYEKDNFKPEASETDNPVKNGDSSGSFREVPAEEENKNSTPKTGIRKWRVPIIISALLLVTGIVAAVCVTSALKSGNKKTAEGTSESASYKVVETNDPGTVNSGDENPLPPQNAGTQNGKTANSFTDTGNLSLYADKYEGRKGTGDFNYGEALQKSLLFYELQRSGDLPEKTRCNWRGDSALEDGADNNVDLTGGLYDAGDNVKFNLPMSYTASVLAWSVYENRKAYEESGQLEFALSNIKWIDDYLIKCHTGKEEYYYQVGDGNLDHAWWGPAETMMMERPSYKVDSAHPGSTVTGEAAAALAAASVVFKESNPEYAKECLQHSKELYDFSAKYLSDDGYTMANGFYSSFSGFYDELSFAAAWLYLSTGEESYKNDALKWFKECDDDYKWTLGWDDVHLGTALIMGRETKDKAYLEHLENNLDYWTTGVGGEKITYTPKGLAWLDSWGSLRYASSAAFLAYTYAVSDVCPAAKKNTYHDFAVSQINYCLGSTGFSYQIHFGDDYPVHPHHRTAHGSYSNNIGDPADSRHILAGALVGGPDASDNYSDEITNYVNNEVACDYNAGFTGALAALYEEYGGQTLVDYGAVENIPDDEITVEGMINVTGENFLEVKAFVYNKSAWPARALTDATLCYFVDLSELYESGGSVNDISVTTNYSQGGSAGNLTVFDEDKHIYYLPVSFAGTVIAPGGQDVYKKEVQFRLTSSGKWDNSNDYSYADIAGTNGSQTISCPHMALYEGENLIYGSVPDGSEVKIEPSGTNTGKSDGKDNGQSEPGKDDNGQSESGKEDPGTGQDGKNASNEVSSDDLNLKIQNQSSKGSSSTMAFTVELTNTGNSDMDLSDVSICYYFSEEDISKLNFYCDYACIQGQQYKAVTESVSGVFSDSKKNDKTAAEVLTVSLKKKETLPAGHTLNIQIRVAKDDWSNLNFDDDYSAKGAEYVVIKSGKNILLGTEPK